LTDLNPVEAASTRNPVQLDCLFHVDARPGRSAQRELNSQAASTRSRSIA
jgi:hypothetical protein